MLQINSSNIRHPDLLQRRFRYWKAVGTVSRRCSIILFNLLEYRGLPKRGGDLFQYPKYPFLLNYQGTFFFLEGERDYRWHGMNTAACTGCLVAIPQAFCTQRPRALCHSPMQYALSGNSPYTLWCWGASAVVET